MGYESALLVSIVGVGLTVVPLLFVLLVIDFTSMAQVTAFLTLWWSLVLPYVSWLANTTIDAYYVREDD